MTHIRPQKPSGFTLIEVSIVVLIVSLIAAGLLNVSTGLKETEKMVDTHKNLERIEQAIKDFYANNDYWPCPASLTAPEGSALFAVSADCNVAEDVDISGTGTVRVGEVGGRVRIGAVPIYNLGLPLQYYRDKWHSRILYAVTEKLTKDNAAFSENSGRVSIVSEDGITSVTGENKAGWILVSHGQDFKGSYSDQGTLRKDCGSTANLDVENCDHVNILTADNIFRQARFNKGTVENKFFDDLIAWGMPVSPSEAKTTKMEMRLIGAFDGDNWSGLADGMIAWFAGFTPNNNSQTFYVPSDQCKQIRGDEWTHCTKSMIQDHIDSGTLIPPVGNSIASGLADIGGWIYDDLVKDKNDNCNANVNTYVKDIYGNDIYWYNEAFSSKFATEAGSIVKITKVSDQFNYEFSEVKCNTKHWVACCKEFRE